MTPPVFAHGHLRLYLLSLLAEQPRHGYDLIQALGERFGGTYSPSAGTIYPRLGKLEAEGLVTRAFDGRKSVYSITDAGRAELASRQAELDGIEVDMDDSVRRLADEVRQGVNDAMKTLKADLASAARDARTESRPAFEWTQSSTDRAEASAAMRSAEALINDFRQQVRVELRTAVARGTLTAGAVTELGKALDTVRRQLAESINVK
jgi:DNA-binding PadR family transcriptional regulator